jgi:5'-nucleotidase
LNFLITNDDGIWAPGLQALAGALAEIGKVWIVAPDRERSAASHSITVHKPLIPKAVELKLGEQAAWNVNGTPADCVKLALEVLMPEPASWVCSGINLGANLATDVLYSGTVSAAAEATLYTLPAVAVSVVEQTEDFSTAANFVRDFLRQFMEKPMESPTLLNINVPSGTPKASRVTTLGVRRYFWMSGERVDCTDDPESDLVAVQEGKISITPLSFQLTDQRMRQELMARGW